MKLVHFIVASFGKPIDSILSVIIALLSTRTIEFVSRAAALLCFFSCRAQQHSCVCFRVARRRLVLLPGSQQACLEVHNVQILRKARHRHVVVVARGPTHASRCRCAAHHHAWHHLRLRRSRAVHAYSQVTASLLSAPSRIRTFSSSSYIHERTQHRLLTHTLITRLIVWLSELE